MPKSKSGNWRSTLDRRPAGSWRGTGAVEFKPCGAGRGAAGGAGGRAGICSGGGARRQPPARAGAAGRERAVRAARPPRATEQERRCAVAGAPIPVADSPRCAASWQGRHVEMDGVDLGEGDVKARRVAGEVDRPPEAQGRAPQRWPRACASRAADQRAGEAVQGHAREQDRAPVHVGQAQGRPPRAQGSLPRHIRVLCHMEGAALPAASIGESTGVRIPHHALHAGGKAAAEAAACGLCGRGFAVYGRGRHAYCKRCTAKADREIARTLRTGCRACGKALATTSRIVRSAQRSAAPRACGAAAARARLGSMPTPKSAP